MTREQQKQKKLRNIEKRAAKLQVQMDDLREKWEETADEIKELGGTVDYTFHDCLA